MENQVGNKKNISMIEKYKCLDFYFNLKDCVRKNKDGECKEEFKRIGECVLTGMKNEEKGNIK